MNQPIEIIATTISGSISDWGKVKRIVPLFREHGFTQVNLHAVDSHLAARRKAAELCRTGKTILIAAGGSGTFNSVLEGSLEGAPDTSRLKLGFLRKGSADLIGKSLGMPDTIEQAITVFTNSIRYNATTPCDVLEILSADTSTPARHFVGYGGAEIFGMVPYFTENRYIKYYKGILSQLFGDLGPFKVGISLSVARKVFTFPRKQWKVVIDGQDAFNGRMQALIITNGDLGPDMPFARGKPLGSGCFYVFIIEDKGIARLPGQISCTWKGTARQNPSKWGYHAFQVEQAMEIHTDGGTLFPVNVDGSTMNCSTPATVRISGQVQLFARHQT